MSLISPQLRFLTLRPSITRDATTLTVRTAFILRLLTLFTFMRRVEFIPSRREVRICVRVAWLFVRECTLSFDEIHHVAYRFKAMTTSWGFTNGFDFGAQDQLESFSIAIVTHGDEEHRVGSFRGEGAIESGWFGVIVGGDAVVDWAGTQECESRRFAEHLADMMDVTVGRPLSGLAATMDCPDCGRPTSRYRDTCLYCGASCSDGEVADSPEDVPAGQR